MGIGRNIQIIRQERKMQQSELAQRTKIARSTISNYENENMAPSGAALLAIARALEVPAEFLSTNNPAQALDAARRHWVRAGLVPGIALADDTPLEGSHLPGDPRQGSHREAEPEDFERWPWAFRELWRLCQVSTGFNFTAADVAAVARMGVTTRSRRGLSLEDAVFLVDRLRGERAAE
jgi:transcriptional regulator with XRE-family HTH domain